MTDEHALLAAMAVDPVDDTVRLAYADFLEERDDPLRAEFVRIQVELERNTVNDMTRYQLVVRHVQLLRECVPQWRAELPQIPGIEWGDFRRGLVEEVQAVNDAAVLRHAEEIFAQPAVHILRIAQLGDGRALADLQEMSRLRALRVIGARAEDRVLRDLLASPHLMQLTLLDPHGNLLADAGAEVLAVNDWPALAELWLGSNQIGNAGARALAASSRMPALSVLDLRGNPITGLDARNKLHDRFKRAVKL